VRPTSERALVDWWFDGLPNCSLLALEVPSLGELVVQMAVERGKRAQTRSVQPVDYYEPQTLTFYRDPFERCRSEWRYEQSICHPWGGLQNAHPHTAEYCQTWFLPRFGAHNFTAVHQAFVREYCTERISRDYERNGVDFAELARSDRLLFVGLAEDYFASTCLFWYQVGRFPFDACSCDSARRAGQRGDSDELMHKGLRRSYTSRQRFAPLGIPDLRMSREAFERRNPGDVVLYREARAVFEARVRLVERRVGTRFSRCGTFRRAR